MAAEVANDRHQRVSGKSRESYADPGIDERNDR